MKARVRQKIDGALATRNRSDWISVAQGIAESILAGERCYTIKQVADLCGIDAETARRKLKGRPGCVQFAPRGDIQITEALLKKFLAEAAARGMEFPD